MNVASSAAASTWPRNALVDATPISGPTRKYTPASVSRAIVEPTTFTRPIVNAPRCRASWSAAQVASDPDPRQPPEEPLRGIEVVPADAVAVVELEPMVEVVVTLTEGDERGPEAVAGRAPAGVRLTAV